MKLPGVVARRRGASLLVLAAVCLLPVFAAPRVWMPAPTYRYLLVLDVTQSMNVRDVEGADGTRSRLHLGREALLQVLAAMPCGSQVSVALFAEGQTLPLFDPLEVCDHYPAMERVISGLQWRMAWAGNSQLDLGVVSALQEARKQSLDLIFVSDGDQTPRRQASRLGTVQAHSGTTRGWMVGVGSEQPRPVPKLDAQDRIVGYWEPHEAQRQGFNPNFVVQGGGLSFAYAGETPAGTDEHLSALRQPELRDLARAAGLQYLRLTDPAALVVAARDPQLAILADAPVDLRFVFGLAAALLLLCGWSLQDRAT
ncbi:vWA domain-containing protein [Panacagrimonas sp.]|uniref:vWA domain-containing protein n=1 Tax=Panacagrimonas sp. TaxID=2480088 RepID=UPI003B51BCEA